MKIHKRVHAWLLDYFWTRDVKCKARALEYETSHLWRNVSCPECLNFYKYNNQGKQKMKNQTLAEWFFKTSGGKLTWTKYKKRFREGAYVSAIDPSDIKRIWNAGAKSGKVQK